MKKAMKKLMAVLLAVAMVCAMAIPAFAAGEDATAGATTGEGKITIDNVVTGNTYKLYRILELEYHAETKAYRYTMNNTWKAFIESRSDDLKVDPATGAVTWGNSETADNGSAIQAFANAAGEYAKNNTTIKPDYKEIADGKNGVHASDNNTTSITFENLPLGWYLVVSDLNNGAICSIDTTDPNVTIKEKNGEPSIEKYVDNDNSNDAGIGDIVNFQIDVAVLDGQPKNYVIHDAMSKGLTFNNDIVVYRYDSVDELTGGNADFSKAKLDPSNYTVTQNPTSCSTGKNCTFEIAFKKDVLKPNNVIIVKYSATVNENAKIGVEGNPNEATLEYDNNPETKHSNTTTYVWEMGVHKFADLGGEDTDHALAGAKFQLYKDVVDKNVTTTMYAIFSNATTSEAGTSVYKLTGWTANASDATTVVTPEKGNIQFVGLDAGTYYLEETTAPTGYNKLTAPITVVIESTLPTKGGAASYTVKANNVEAPDYIVRVENKAGTELPSTGGIGTTIFYVVGGGLMVAAAILLITKKRMENR